MSKKIHNNRATCIKILSKELVASLAQQSSYSRTWQKEAFKNPHEEQRNPPLNFYPGSVSMSSTKQLTKSEANLHEIQQNTSRSPSTGLQDIGYHHYPSTVHKKSWQKIHYWMKVFMYLCNTQGNHLKWSLRLSESMEYLHWRGGGGWV